jgi:hypothetical protein
MNRRNFLKNTTLGSLGLGIARRTFNKSVSSTQKKPNIILILADDLGWNDVGYHGGVPKTPNIDKLAAGGLQLDRFYVCPVCSPTRACLMTGRYSIRFGLMRAVIPPWRKYGLPPEEETMAEMLAQGGVQASRLFGEMASGAFQSKISPSQSGIYLFLWLL